MPYSVTTTSGAQTITIADGAVDTSQLSVALIGRNATNYGDDIARNFIRMLENFASISQPNPTTKLVGQQWYDTGDSVMRVWDGAVWKQATSILVSGTAPSTNLADGVAYFDSVDKKLKIYDGAVFREAAYGGTVTGAYSGNTALGTPTRYGSYTKTIFLQEATTLTPKAVLAMVYVSDGSTNGGATSGETIMAIFSDWADFAVDVSDPYYAELAASGGIGTTVRIGLNQRQEYAGTATALAEEAVTASNINTSGGNVSADAVIHTGRSYVPDTGNTYNLGSATSTFDEGYFNDLYIGNGTTGSINMRGTVIIGSNADRVSQIWATDITADQFDGVATSAQYADLAEVYASDADYEPGTVLELGGAHEVTLCDADYSLSVFGVVSTDPGFLMNSRASGVQVALDGRVPVKLVGGVNKGDRLVSAGNGQARRLRDDEAYDPRGIIGRALEDHSGDGIVEARVGVI
jgi:hypothetical protein